MSKDIEAAQSQSATAASQGHANVTATAPTSGAVVTDNEHEAPTSDQAASGGEEQQWDEAAVVSRSKTVSNSSAPEVLDMKSISQNKGSDNISEKLRVEETKAQLAAAREGMEREAARAKAEKERKEQEAQEKEAAKAASGGGGIWVSARMRASQNANLSKVRMGVAGKQQQLDTSNEELFPDLAAADKILEQKEKSAQPARVPKKTPVGGGASWATKTNSNKTPAKPPMKSAAPSDQEQEDRKSSPGDEGKKAEVADATAAGAGPSKTEKEDTPSESPDPTPAKVPETETTAAAVPATKPKATKKKKKKDLSSFKPGS